MDTAPTPGHRPTPEKYLIEEPDDDPPAAEDDDPTAAEYDDPTAA